MLIIMPNHDMELLGKYPKPMAESIPSMADAGKKSANLPIFKNPKRSMKTPENTMAANVNRYPWYRSPLAKVDMAPNNTMNKPLPGPVMVTLEPPRTDTTIPPTTAAMIPEIGGASLAIANPSPSGRAIRETTNPENIFCGKVWIKFLVWLVFLGVTVGFV